MTGIVTATHAAESGHWYDSTGRQVLTVTGAKGQPVKPDVRHARKLDLAPGVTTIIGCQDRPGLTVYRERQALMCALTLTRTEGETDEAFIARILRDAKEASEKAAERGTEIHADIESHFRTMPAADLWSSRAIAVRQELFRLTKGAGPWWPERACVSPLGYGTKSDLCALGWVVDIKTKDGNLDDEKTWDEHAQQLAATRMALHATYPDEGFDQARCAILFASRTEDIARGVEIEEPELQRGEECFRALVRYWRAKHKHRPTWAKEEP